MSRSAIVIFMRDAILAIVIIAVLIFLDRRENQGRRHNPLRKPWRGKPEDAENAAWRAPWAGEQDAEDEHQDDADARIRR